MRSACTLDVLDDDREIVPEGLAVAGRDGAVTVGPEVQAQDPCPFGKHRRALESLVLLVGPTRGSGDAVLGHRVVLGVPEVEVEMSGDEGRTIGAGVALELDLDITMVDGRAEALELPLLLGVPTGAVAVVIEPGVEEPGAATDGPGGRLGGEAVAGLAIGMGLEIGWRKGLPARETALRAGILDQVLAVRSAARGQQR